MDEEKKYETPEENIATPEGAEEQITNGEVPKTETPNETETSETAEADEQPGTDSGGEDKESDSEGPEEEDKWTGKHDLGAAPPPMDTE